MAWVADSSCIVGVSKGKQDGIKKQFGESAGRGKTKPIIWAVAGGGGEGGGGGGD